MVPSPNMGLLLTGLDRSTCQWIPRCEGRVAMRPDREPPQVIVAEACFWASSRE